MHDREGVKADIKKYPNNNYSIIHYYIFKVLLLQTHLHEETQTWSPDH